MFLNSSCPAVSLPLLFEHDGYLQSGKAERNFPILLKDLEHHPGNPYILFQTAKTCRNLNRHEDACRYFSDFYRLVPYKGTGYRTTGIILYLHSLMELGDYDTALSIVSDEAERLGAYADYHFTCGILFMKAILSDTQKYLPYLPYIEQSYLRCLDIGEVPLHQGTYGCGSFKAAYNLGTWYEVSGNLPRALECYRDAARQKYAPAIKRLQALSSSS